MFLQFIFIKKTGSTKLCVHMLICWRSKWFGFSFDTSSTDCFEETYKHTCISCYFLVLMWIQVAEIVPCERQGSVCPMLPIPCLNIRRAWIILCICPAFSKIRSFAFQLKHYSVKILKVSVMVSLLGSGEALALIRQQAITWTCDDRDPLHNINGLVQERRTWVTSFLHEPIDKALLDNKKLKYELCITWNWTKSWFDSWLEFFL